MATEHGYTMKVVVRRTGLSPHLIRVWEKLVYPPDDLHLPQEFTRLRQYLPQEVAVFVSGRAAEGYRDILQRIGAVLPNSLAEFRVQLETLRTQDAFLSP